MCIPRWGVVLVATAACGDNLPGVGPPLAPADTLFVVAHLDDDLIFMQPELATALATGSVTTVYVSSGDPVHGFAHAEHTFEATMTAYAYATGSSDWDCGYLRVTGVPLHHCRLRDRPVSMIGLDVSEGGRYGERPDSLLHLVDQTVPSLPILGELGGRVTVASLTAELAEIIAVTAPHELHTLDLAASHGDDHAGHLIAASFALWAAASAGYRGTIVSHRGYNVANEPANLSDADYAFAKPMLGYFEACYRGCAPCGTECATLEPSHDTWLRRQYAATAAPISATGKLESEDAPGSCLTPTGEASLELADCATAAAFLLDADRHLRVAGRCASSASDNDAAIDLVRCADDPAQYWLSDDEGFVANGRPPNGIADMYFDHVRCLDATHPERAGAPICGSRVRPRWHLLP
jgi:LmbE family N-acetylglucosaminyl deacetylase